jgi:hypothetical protein
MHCLTSTTVAAAMRNAIAYHAGAQLITTGAVRCAPEFLNIISNHYGQWLLLDRGEQTASLHATARGECYATA